MIFKSIKIVFVFLILTIITQVGGIVYLVCLFIDQLWKKRFRLKLLSLFLIVYSISTLWIVPTIAKYGGREKVISKENIQPANVMTVFLNRNYVTKEMNIYLDKVSTQLSKTDNNIKLRYLDACFPFFDGFPLLPHLSHNDGRKIDFSLVYENEAGRIINAGKSISGYGVFEDPERMEYKQCETCLKLGYWQYDFPKYLTFGQINKEIQFSSKGTATLIRCLLTVDGIGKLFIEPHLKQRMKLSDSRIRFQGCRSVRHDDHIHVQIK